MGLRHTDKYQHTYTHILTSFRVYTYFLVYTCTYTHIHTQYSAGSTQRMLHPQPDSSIHCKGTYQSTFSREIWRQRTTPPDCTKVRVCVCVCVCACLCKCTYVYMYMDVCLPIYCTGHILPRKLVLANHGHRLPAGMVYLYVCVCIYIYIYVYIYIYTHRHTHMFNNVLSY
jgi:hypothetical protein